MEYKPIVPKSLTTLSLAPILKPIIKTNVKTMGDNTFPIHRKLSFFFLKEKAAAYPAAAIPKYNNSVFISIYPTNTSDNAGTYVIIINEIIPTIK